MNIFSGIYANYYDLFYSSKNYKKEVDYVLKICSKFNLYPKNILDLGCGTGNHAFEYSKKNIKVLAVDQSDEMIKIANKKLSRLNNKRFKDLVLFEKNNILNFNTAERFDLITCMFAVLGYITDTNDLIKLFSNISKFLKEGSIFICDTWYGNSVLKEKPSIRFHEFSCKNKKIFRIAKPYLNTKNQVVSIDYNIIEISEKTTNLYKENHLVRYFFYEEMKIFGIISGMKLIDHKVFLSEREPGDNDWNVTWIFRKI